VGQVFRAEAAREFAAGKQTGGNIAGGDKFRDDTIFHFSFDSGK